MGKVSRTQVVKYIRKGDKGDPGAKGDQGAVMRGPQAWSDCAVGYVFQSGGDGEQWKDVVLYNGNYYSCVKSHIKTDSNYPNSDEDNNKGYWRLGDKIELVAANLLLSNYALIKNLGAEAIEMKNSDGETVFLAKDGKLQCYLGTFNNIDVQSGKIAGFYIDGNGLTNKPFTNDAYIVFRNDKQGAFAGIGGNVLQSSSGIRGVARFENKDTSDSWNVGVNYAMLLSAQGTRENCAIHIDGGYITGIALKNKTINETTTLDRFDQNIITVNDAEITITLPTMQPYDDGHIVRIKRLGKGLVKIALGYCYTFNGNTTRYSKPVLVYDDNRKIKHYETLNILSECDAMDFVWVRDIVHTIDNVRYYGAWLQYKLPREW